MKKIVITLTLIIIATNAYAEWAIYSVVKDGVLFYDKDTIRRNGDKVKVWDYVNFNLEGETDPDLLKYSSQRSLVEIDCINETYTTLHSDLYSKPNLEGDYKKLGSNNEKKYIVPNSTFARLMKLTCKK
jgi:hypothetical protein